MASLANLSELQVTFRVMVSESKEAVYEISYVAKKDNAALLQMILKKALQKHG